MSLHKHKPSIRESRTYWIAGDDPDEVLRAARYLKGRGYGRIVQYTGRAALHCWAGFGRALVILVASPRVHEEAEKHVKTRGVQITQQRKGSGHRRASMAKGQWVEGTFCPRCSTCTNVRRPGQVSWMQQSHRAKGCRFCHRLSDLQLLALVGGQLG